MTTIQLDTAAIHVPEWVNDLASFRRWVHSDELPERCPVFFLAGEVWLDMAKAQLFSHVRLKQRFYQVLGVLADADRLGDFFPDGLLLTNEDADLSGNPDGTFVSKEALREGRVRLVEGAEDGYVELEGTPDMVLEVVSDSSVVKDTDVLCELYWKAGIREYWLVDARGERLQFSILRHSRTGYVPVRKASGWLKSAVFQKSFKLTRETDEFGHPSFQLDVR